VASGRHSYPGEKVGYIVRRDVAMEFDDRATLTLHTGDPFLMPPGVVHNARNIGTVATKMLGWIYSRFPRTDSASSPR
jgi:quercetin dioxygenase-like cupin family protein